MSGNKLWKQKIKRKFCTERIYVITWLSTFHISHFHIYINFLVLFGSVYKEAITMWCYSLGLFVFFITSTIYCPRATHIPGIGKIYKPMYMFLIALKEHKKNIKLLLFFFIRNKSSETFPSNGKIKFKKNHETKLFL